MNEKTINEQYAYIRTLLEEKRLKEALMQLESLLWQCPDWDLRTRLEQLQTSYKYMLEYMKQGCLLYTSPSPRDVEESRMPSSA